MDTRQDYAKSADNVNCEENIDIEILYQESPRTFYTQIPNIVFHLGLSPTAFLLYSYYRSIGACFKSQATIQRETGLSDKTIRNVHKELKQNFEKLGTKPLIVISRRVKPDGGKNTNLITIIDIWIENDLFFNKSLRSVKFTGGVGKNLPEGGEKFTDKQYPSNKTPKEQQQPPASFKPEDSKPLDAVVVFLSSKEGREIEQLMDSAGFSEKDKASILKISLDHKKLIKVISKALKDDNITRKVGFIVQALKNDWTFEKTKREIDAESKDLEDELVQREMDNHVIVQQYQRKHWDLIKDTLIRTKRGYDEGAIYLTIDGRKIKFNDEMFVQKLAKELERLNFPPLIKQGNRRGH